MAMIFCGCMVVLVFYIITILLIPSTYNLIARCFGSQPSHEIVPESLSVRELKELSDQRGVPYDNVVEKAELRRLVKTSGRLTTEEIESLQQTTTVKSCTHFKKACEYGQRGKSTKEGAWLVMVIAKAKNKARAVFPLKQKSWEVLGQRVERLGVRTAMMDCSRHFYKDNKRCMRRASSHFVLFLPKFGIKTRSSAFAGPFKLQNVYNWMQDELRGNVEHITNSLQLQMNWLTFKETQRLQETRVLLVTDQPEPAPFFCALSAHFTDSVRFAWLNTKNVGRGNLSEALNVDPTLPLPVVVIANMAGAYVYGLASTECFTFSCLKTFLSHFLPDPTYILKAICVIAMVSRLLKLLFLEMPMIISDYVIFFAALLFWVDLSFENSFTSLFIHKTVCTLVTTSFWVAMRQGFLLLRQSSVLLPVVGLLAVSMYFLLIVYIALQIILAALLMAFKLLCICCVWIPLINPILVLKGLIVQKTNAILRALNHNEEDLRTWPFRSNENDSESCSICLDKYANGETLTKGWRCNHVFHYCCLTRWLNVRKNGKCPLCRRSVRQTLFSRIWNLF